MTTIKELNLTESEIKKVKKDFNNGQVYTDGCFCGHAISNFRDYLYLIMDFSCRKSMSCDGSYYQVNSVMAVEKAIDVHSEDVVKKLLEFYEADSIDLDVYQIDDNKLYIHEDSYNPSTINDIYLIRNDMIFGNESLKNVQKKLFKYYMKTYGVYSEAKFKDTVRFYY